MIPVQRPSIGAAELEAVGRVFETGWLGMGSVTKEFEEKIGAYLGARHVVSTNTGTSALHLALAGVMVGAGDEVILPSLTFAATAQAIVTVGARPVFCDVEPASLTIDVEDAWSRVTPRTKVIIPVHYGGQACAMDDLLERGRQGGIRVVEDAAHAFGSSYRRRRIGSFGDITCFSFDPIKNITCGEGGAVVTADADLAERMRQMRILGIDKDTWSRYRNERSWFYSVSGPGFRYHLSNVNAAIGLQQLSRFEWLDGQRRRIAARYDAAFCGSTVVQPLRRNVDETCPFFYVVRVPGGRRDEMMRQLKSDGIDTGVHYIPNHLHPFFGHDGRSLPVTERAYEEILTLPLFPDLREADVDKVVESVTSFNASRA